MIENRNFGEILHDMIEGRVSEIFTCLPGEVVSWNSSIETATIKPTVKDPEGNTLPNIVGVKVCFPGVYWDLEAGETGIVLFSMLDFDTWWRTGQIEEPANLDTHDFDTAIFLPGMKRKATSRNVPSGATVLAGDDVRLGEDDASEAVIRGDAYTSDENTFLTALGVFLLAFDVWTAAVAVQVPALAGAATTMQTASGVFKTAADTFKSALPGDLSTKVSVD